MPYLQVPVLEPAAPEAQEAVELQGNRARGVATAARWLRA